MKKPKSLKHDFRVWSDKLGHEIHFQMRANKFRGRFQIDMIRLEPQPAAMALLGLGDTPQEAWVDFEKDFWGLKRYEKAVHYRVLEEWEKFQPMLAD